MSDVMLLVGGPADGRRIRVDGRPKIYYVPRANRVDLTISEPRFKEEEIQLSRVTEEYVRRERGVYVHHSIDHMDVIELLAAGYRCEIGS